jgi:hypothetical protein
MIKEAIQKNPKIKIFLGILWGVAIGLLFRSACYGRKCVIISAPKERDVTSKVYSSDSKDGKCYRLVSTSSECSDKTIDE